MAALIEFACIAKHEGGRGDPVVTLVQRSWAYCATGAGDVHEWSRIVGTSIETLRSRPGNGRPYFAHDQSDEHSLTARPAR